MVSTTMTLTVGMIHVARCQLLGTPGGVDRFFPSGLLLLLGMSIGLRCGEFRCLLREVTAMTTGMTDTSMTALLEGLALS